MDNDILQSSDSINSLFTAISELFSASDILAEAAALSLVLVLTWLASKGTAWTLKKFQRRKRNRRSLLAKWTPTLRMMIWAIGLAISVMVLFQASAVTILVLSLPVALGLGLASQDLIRNLLAGVILSLDREFETGDVLRVGQHEGEVISIGLRNIKLMAFDGHVIEIPNSRFLAETSTNVTPETNDAQVKIVMVLPAGVRLENARSVAYTAAVVSRYGSLREPAEVFIDTDGSEDLMTRLTIRGHVFDPTFEEHYRSDVISLVRRGIGLAGVSVTPITTTLSALPEMKPSSLTTLTRSAPDPIIESD